jgi:hypothetical protein
MEEKASTLKAEEFVENAVKRCKNLSLLDKKAILDFKKRSKTKGELEKPTFTVILFFILKI